MKVISAGYRILTPISTGGVNELRQIEQIARVCYKSEGYISDGSALRLISHLLEHGHEAMLEHSQLSVIFTVDRGVSHELVRHRMASFAQESTRYCNYSKDKFDNSITVIQPYWLVGGSEGFSTWYSLMCASERAYFDLLSIGATPQEARSVLPNSLKTDIVVTANYREWRHILRLRTDEAAHPQMREVMCPLLTELQDKIPLIFDKV